MALARPADIAMARPSIAERLVDPSAARRQFHAWAKAESTRRAQIRAARWWRARGCRLLPRRSNALRREVEEGATQNRRTRGSSNQINARTCDATLTPNAIWYAVVG